jgi:hypothetical protein
MCVAWCECGRDYRGVDIVLIWNDIDTMQVVKTFAVTEVLLIVTH